MHCHYTATAGELRLYDQANGYQTRQDYRAIINVLWLSDSKVMLRGAHGKLTKSVMRAAVTTLYQAGARTVIANRAKGHVLPLATCIEEGDFMDTWQLDLQSLKKMGVMDG